MHNKGKQLYEYVSSYIVFDLETTGISCSYDEIVEISAIKVVDGKVIGEFSKLVNPKRFIPYAASAVNGITDAMVRDEPGFDEVLPKFLDFIGDGILVGHNIHTFDLKFIYRDCEKYLGKTLTNNYVDTLRLAKRVLPQLSHYKLTDLAQHYQIPVIGAHRALNDCRMNQQLFEALGRDMTDTTTVNVNLKICPKCGDILKMRKGRFGEFLGCSGYPNCRYTENL